MFRELHQLQPASPLSGLAAAAALAPRHHLQGSSSPHPHSKCGVGTGTVEGDGTQYRTLTCTTCSKGFHGRNSKSNLERHMQIHTGVKPFQCPLCPHRANRKGNLKTHIEAKHGTEACALYM
ncbi:hypothetical protein SK128_018443 [Halocaridina rubra]|uniref:C2H2-type domain-containing protein n=1 Tax=Halocaridina rubra TaxID=373956 RepID=A0AAN8XH02_HALRR